MAGNSCIPRLLIGSSSHDVDSGAEWQIVNNYPQLLLRRARHAMPRQQAEQVATALQERNARCLLSWRVRWAQHRPLPDAWDKHWRQFYDMVLEHARELALRWLASRPAKRRGEKIVKGYFSTRRSQ